tara:strand:- start:14102 stop:14647 length:546 start_codon:yes stop_codon:yes gene_type:complete
MEGKDLSNCIYCQLDVCSCERGMHVMDMDTFPFTDVGRAAQQRLHASYSFQPLHSSLQSYADSYTDGIMRARADLARYSARPSIQLEVSDFVGEENIYKTVQDGYGSVSDADSFTTTIVCSLDNALKVVFSNGIYGNDTVAMAGHLCRAYINRKLEAKWSAQEKLCVFKSTGMIFINSNRK